MNLTRLTLTPLSLLLTAGSTLLLFLLLLSGLPHNPLNRIYLLSASTQNIPNAPSTAHWTFYAVCSARGGVITDCSSHTAAHPILPQDDFDTRDGIPSDFWERRDAYYHLSKTGYAFLLLGVTWGTLSVFTGILACCSKKMEFLSAVLSTLGFLSLLVAAPVLTAVTVMARNAWRSVGRESNVGVKAMAFWWTSMVCFLLAMIGFWISYMNSRRRERGTVSATSGTGWNRGRFGMGGRPSEGGESDHGLTDAEKYRRSQEHGYTR